MFEQLSFSIRRVHDVQRVLDFQLHARSSMFGARMAAQGMPHDLQFFDAVYGTDSGCMLAAVDVHGAVLGTIGYRAYDHRFAHLNLPKEVLVAEVVRLFVQPAYRQHGLGSALWLALQCHAQGQGCEMLYLHTHPFLPGAQAFWSKQGFVVIHRDQDPVWQSIHMQMAIPAVRR
ncbi:GNAT family N-acetyltransferase [Lampropedia puyangensis]|uniref:GNAT family N-acetyltransferase n=1 Tax=Lampropedia puyangensis TaxID=1330072 RepID=A0A4S8EZ76_9BURK|nr:GNAT family N-acetyltransferase [Lampropedia puyangensis]THT99003.1 GNAT family N-acetyltransferase [Lampropedia puyangensis]